MIPSVGYDTALKYVIHSNSVISASWFLSALGYLMYIVPRSKESNHIPGQEQVFMLVTNKLDPHILILAPSDKTQQIYDSDRFYQFNHFHGRHNTRHQATGLTLTRKR